MLKALEFFSGIGAFSQACLEDARVKVVGAFDQSEAANACFALNYGIKPCSKNLDSIRLEDIPAADIWWLSPPCTPYSVRGKRQDKNDPRAKSILHLIDLLAARLPTYFLLENVLGFAQSQVRGHLLSRLSSLGYQVLEIQSTPMNFGVPMRRPRYFLMAGLSPAGSFLANPELSAPPLQPLKTYLQCQNLSQYALSLDYVQRYGNCFDIVDPDSPQAVAICFTSSYYKCAKSSGSFIKTEGGLRYFSPQEILRLLGFSDQFEFAPDLDLPVQYKLVGNSVDVRQIKRLLQILAV